jgi:hypothetical protein
MARIQALRGSNGALPVGTGASLAPGAIASDCEYSFARIASFHACLATPSSDL